MKSAIIYYSHVKLSEKQQPYYYSADVRRLYLRMVIVEGDASHALIVADEHKLEGETILNTIPLP